MANHKHSKKELAALARQREARIDYQNDLQVLSIDQCAKLENTSRPTLLRQIDAGNGPRTIQLSARRVGVRRSRLSRMEGAADASVKEKADGRVQTRHRLFVLEGHARMSNPTERDIESGSAWKLSPRIARHNSPPSGAEQKMSFQTLAAANVAGPTLAAAMWRNKQCGQRCAHCDPRPDTGNPGTVKDRCVRQRDGNPNRAHRRRRRKKSPMERRGDNALPVVRERREG